MTDPAVTEAPRAAAEALIAAFAAHDRDAYFASFTPEATFVFHHVPERLADRAAYEALWARWESEGFRVESCVSSAARVDVIADGVAVFVHDVDTRLAGEAETLRERETIVLVRQADGRWLAVHEHLSPRA